MNHPSTNPELPSFLESDYLFFQEELETVYDVWSDLKGVVRSYVPKEIKESYQAYASRIKRCKFDNRFEPAIKGQAGLLSSFSLNGDVAPSIIDCSNNIDNQGNSIHAFFKETDEVALRDGWCGVMVDYPPSVDLDSQADFIDRGRRPYLVLIDRRDILNWRYYYKTDGSTFLTQLTIRERRKEAVGAYGSAEAIYYRVLYPGGFSLFQIIKGQNNSWQLVLREQGETSLDFIPLTYYSISKSPIFSAKPPLINLANLNIEHFQKRSQLNEVLRKCNLPVPVRKGLIRNVEDLKKAPPVTIGPNFALDIPADGDFYFAEPSGAAIEATEKNIEKLEAAMDRLSLAFLTGGEREKTATEVLLDTAQTSASLKGMAEMKTSHLQTIFQNWAAYTGEKIGGTISIDESILQQPLSPDATSRLQDLAQTGFISQETLLYHLKLGKILSKDFDIQREVQFSVNGNPQNDYPDFSAES